MIQNPETHLNKLKRSATLAINERSDKLANEGKTIYRFGFGQSPFPIPDMVTKTLQENASRKNYLPVDGLFELRQSVAKYHQHTDTVAIEPEQVLIGPGSKELIFTLQLVIGGSTIIPTPCWVSYGPQGQILKRKTEFIQTNYEDNWRLLPNQLTKTIKDVSGPHLLILNYPGNPDGLTYNQDELEKLANICRKNNVIIICAEIENQIMELDPKDRKYFMTESRIKETGLDLLIKTGYKILKLITFFTSTHKETRAWTISKQCKAIKAAGLIHSDFEKGFIKAETISYDDFVFYKGYNEAKNTGKLRLEGKDYIVKDGEILYFRFST